MPVPDFAHDFKSYDRFDIGAMGEFDVALLMDQYVGPERSKRLYPEWRGGYYYAARPKGNAAAPLGFSTCRGGRVRKRLRSLLRFMLGRSRSGIKAPTKLSQIVLETRSGDDEPNIEVLKGLHRWTTEEGTVLIEEQGATVLVSESLDAATTQTLEKEVFGK